METIAVELREVFRDEFGDEELEIRDEMGSGDIPAWDSLMHINLMVASEKRFGIRFTTAEMSRLKQPGQNIGSFRDLIERKMTEKSR